MEESKNSKLKIVAANSLQTKQQWIEAFKTDGNKRIGSMALWGIHEIYSLKSFFIDGDIKAAKQSFSTCGQLDVFLTNEYDEKLLDYGINHLSYALLSDNKRLIDEYANLKHSNYEKSIHSGGATPMFILQCLIKDDMAEYEKAMIFMKTKTLKKFGMELDYDFYEALANRNTSKIKSVLEEFVKPVIHKRRNKYHELVNEFISHPAIGYAKLAWIKGMELYIDSPLIPHELLPVSPIDNYVEEYPFLKK
jgi:Immunity protein 49